MRFVPTAATLVLAALPLAVPAAQHLDVKVGEWENSWKTTSGGDPAAMMPDLSKMPPERRAKIEEMMKQRAATGPKTRSSRHCLKAEDLDKPFAPPKETRNQCKHTVVESSATRIVMKGECTLENGGTVKQDIQFTASNRETVSGTMDVVFDHDGKQATRHMEFSGKWLGPTCQAGDRGMPGGDAAMPGMPDGMPGKSMPGKDRPGRERPDGN